MMKNLDLNAYGVQEMNQQEMMETDGGLVWVAVIAVVAVVGLFSSCNSDQGSPSTTIKVEGNGNTINIYHSATLDSVSNNQGNGNTTSGSATVPLIGK